MISPPPIRDVRDDDSTALARLIAESFAEYDNCHFVWDEFPELRAPATHYNGRGGRLWVAQDANGAIVGSLGAVPVPEQNAVELVKVYAAPQQRGTGLAQALFAEALAFAEARDAREMMLWSDTRFTRGHGFYGKLGFVRWPGTRFLADQSDTWEFHFRKRLGQTT